MRPDSERLRDILDAADAIVAAVAGLDLEAFLGARTTRDATLHNLMVIGEAASKLSTSLRDAYPAVEWRPIIGFRNVIVHDYARLTAARVWDTVSQDIPVLRAQIAAIFAAEFPGEDM